MRRWALALVLPILGAALLAQAQPASVVPADDPDVAAGWAAYRADRHEEAIEHYRWIETVMPDVQTAKPHRLTRTDRVDRWLIHQTSERGPAIGGVGKGQMVREIDASRCPAVNTYGGNSVSARNCRQSSARMDHIS